MTKDVRLKLLEKLALQTDRNEISWSLRRIRYGTYVSANLEVIYAGEIAGVGTFRVAKFTDDSAEVDLMFEKSTRREVLCHKNEIDRDIFKAGNYLALAVEYQVNLEHSDEEIKAIDKYLNS
ncbi:MAG: hypothetical protein LBK41_04940 [Clostridiales bacterium]|nr:hypothetical protein [Clostridiales bacterium]